MKNNKMKDDNTKPWDDVPESQRQERKTVCERAAARAYYVNCQIDTIVVWDFYQAPKELQKLSLCGGDEDWIALIPKSYKDRYIAFLEEPRFANIVDEFMLSNGIKILIGSHS